MAQEHEQQAGPPVRLVQIVVAPWKGITGDTYSLYGLGEDGRAYRFDVGCQGWFQLPDTTVLCKHRR